MADSLTDVLKEAYALAPANKIIYDTLQISQEGIQDSVYLVRSRRSLRAKDENGVDRVFEPVGFNFSLPAASTDGFRSLNVVLDNVSERAIDFIKTAVETQVEVSLTYRPYTSDDLTQPQMDPPLVLFLKDVTITGASISGRATFMDVVNAKFPIDLYLRDRFPALE